MTNNTEIKIDSKLDDDGNSAFTVTVKAEKQLTEKEKILKFLEHLADFLTIRHVALLSLLTIMFMFIWATYEQRNHIFAQAMVFVSSGKKPASWELSSRSKNQIQALTDGEKVGAVMVTDMVLRRNVKVTKYYYIHNEDLAKHFSALEVKYQGPTAIFTNNQANTDRMLAILNREFVCIKTQNSYYASIPKLVESFPTLCSVSIPATPGDLAGFITIALVRELTEEELASVRLELFSAASDIYKRDVEKSPEFVPKGRK